METDEINYKILRRIQQEEQSSPSLSKLDIQFYQKLVEYLHELDSAAEKEKDPQKYKILQEEIQNTKKIATNVYEQREKKIVHASLSASRGGKPELKNLLDTEKILYENLVELIAKTRDNILIKKTQQPIVEKTGTPKKTLPIVNSVQDPNQNPIVRVTMDIPTFVGTDMKTYVLQKEDVLSLEKEMVEPLRKKGVIQHLR